MRLSRKGLPIVRAMLRLNSKMQSESLEVLRRKRLLRRCRIEEQHEPLVFSLVSRCCEERMEGKRLGSMLVPCRRQVSRWVNLWACIYEI